MAVNQLRTGFSGADVLAGPQNNVACRRIAKNDPQPFSKTVGEFGDDRIVARQGDAVRVAVEPFDPAGGCLECQTVGQAPVERQRHCLGVIVEVAADKRQKLRVLDVVPDPSAAEGEVVLEAAMRFAAPAVTRIFGDYHDVAPVALHGGATSGRRRLKRFLDERLAHYGDNRNDVDVSATSGLSPYLHFGHVGSHEVLAALAGEMGAPFMVPPPLAIERHLLELWAK